MMEVTESERRILAEWNAWVADRRGAAPPTHKDAHDFYFRHLEPNRPDLLAFEADADKWALVQSWLRVRGGVR